MVARTTSVALGFAGMSTLAIAACVLPEYEAAEGGGGAIEGGGGTASGGDGAGGSTGDAPVGGAGGAGGGSSGGGGAAPIVQFSSCNGLVPTCGPGEDEDCCRSVEVPPGQVYRSLPFCSGANPPALLASVSAFRMDKYEVSVGRFRKFLAALSTSPPPEGAGAHPSSAASGWQASYPYLTADEIRAELSCDPRATWTDEATEGDNLPINCVSWYEALLFCAWDGGRLATEAEFNYVGAVGLEGFRFPWGDAELDDTRAVYTVKDVTPQTPIGIVGSKPDGNHRDLDIADISGNVEEWLLDMSNDSPTTGSWCTDFPIPCNDCVDITSGEFREHRGGSYADEYELNVDVRRDAPPTERTDELGFRCVRHSELGG